MIKIAVLPGDGIGQDVTYAALPIFKALNIPVQLNMGEVGWECWKKEGNPIPKRTWDLIHSSDCTLLGAVTSKPEREALKELNSELNGESFKYISPVVQLRQALSLFANVRPIFNFEETNEEKNKLCVIRENTEGLYSGFDYYPISDDLYKIISENDRWKGMDKKDITCSLRLQSRSGLERFYRYAFSYAKRKNISRITLADKPNVLRKSSILNREIFESVASEYPFIKADILNVDAVALWMVRRPDEFGVIVSENMFGDILSDLGAGIMGGLGFAPSANIGLDGSYFEPVHGSAPQIAPNKANPSAMFLTIALLLDHLGFNTQSNQIKQAIRHVIKENKFITYDLGGKSSTIEMANSIIEHAMKGISHL